MHTEIKTIRKKTALVDFWIDHFILRTLSARSSRNSQLRGQRMAVFANDWVGLGVNVKGIYEIDLLDSLMTFLAPLKNEHDTWTVLDIGANIGNHSVFFSRRFGRVIAFEPNPSTFQLLRFNAQYSSNIQVINAGLGTEKGYFTLYEDTKNFGASSIINQHSATSTVSVEIQVLDESDYDFGNLGLIKIDVEGMEEKVLKGAISVIQQHNPIIVFEQNESEFIGDGKETATISLLRSLDYDICWIKADTIKRSWLSKRLVNLYELFFGKTVDTSIVRADIVPKNTYSMLIAVPQKHRKLLGLAA